MMRRCSRSTCPLCAHFMALADDVSAVCAVCRVCVSAVSDPDPLAAPAERHYQPQL